MTDFRVESNASGGSVTVGGAIGSGTAGALLAVNPANTIAQIIDVALNNVLLSGGVNTLPTYGKVSLSAAVTGNLPVGNLNGGSGAGSGTYWQGDGTWGVPVGSGGSPGGGEGNVQLNRSSAFYGDSTFTYDGNTLTVLGSGGCGGFIAANFGFICQGSSGINGTFGLVSLVSLSFAGGICVGAS